MFGVETFTMMVVYGTPVHDKTAPTAINYSGASLDVVSKFQGFFQVYDKSMRDNHIFDNLGQVPPDMAETVGEDVDGFVNPKDAT
jgi:hypothetical protein